MVECGGRVRSTSGERRAGRVTTLTGVLTEDEALELLAYLVTSARTQVDEAGEYGPMRLMTAARRLGAAMAAHSSPSTAEFVAGPLTTLPELAVPKVDREDYVARLDRVCSELAIVLRNRYVP